ncbi:SEPT3_9_12 [Mytilus edulis]|uniref:SEPT3_9_12 n=1 Tax=Mytilus edulis TaxID=6550 RepID=A0A8S3S0I1_MYTED|nr:SEPT3_9_12 [Mytilus edulis]
MIGKYKSWWKNVKKMFGGEDEYQKFLKEDIDLAVSAFLPKQLLDNFSDRDPKLEEAVMIVFQMNHSLKQLYSGICSFIGIAFDTLFANVLLLQMKKMIQKFQLVKQELHADGDADENIDILHLFKAAIAVHFVIKFDLQLDKTETDVLCEALLPRPNYTDRTCTDIILMKKSMSSIVKEVNSILIFAKRIAEKTDNPSWLLCIPVIHFLCLDIKPFQQVPDELNFNDANQDKRTDGGGSLFSQCNQELQGIQRREQDAVDTCNIVSAAVDTSSGFFGCGGYQQRGFGCGGYQLRGFGCGGYQQRGIGCGGYQQHDMQNNPMLTYKIIIGTDN